MSRLRVLGAAAAVIALALDQIVKFTLVHGFAALSGAPRPLGPFLDLTLRWNPGISFSFFPQQTGWGVSLLLAFTLAATLALALWLWRCASLPTALGLGLIIGGALGNAFDRFTFGAVLDFLDLHMFGRHFFVFNGADFAITLGVVLLGYDMLFTPEGSSAQGVPPGAKT